MDLVCSPQSSRNLQRKSTRHDHDLLLAAFLGLQLELASKSQECFAYLFPPRISRFLQEGWLIWKSRCYMDGCFAGEYFAIPPNPDHANSRQRLLPPAMGPAGDELAPSSPELGVSFRRSRLPVLRRRARRAPAVSFAISACARAPP